MKVFFLILKGIAVGGANVLPGVSGAVLAVILRIYDKLIESVNNLFVELKKSLKFLIPVGIGMAIGVLAVGEALDFFLVRFSLQSSGFIAGLMAGSLPFIQSQASAKKPDKAKNTAIKTKFEVIRYKPYFYAITVAAAAVVILLALFVPGFETVTEAEGVYFSVVFAIHLFVGGVFAAMAMIVPGVSGAMVLMLFGLFPTVMHTITLIRQYLMSPFDFELLGSIFIIVVPLGFGIVVGILLGSKVIALLLKKFRSATYFAILGLVFGTIFAIFNAPETYQSHDEITPLLIIITAVTFICGMVVSLIFGRKKFE